MGGIVLEEWRPVGGVAIRLAFGQRRDGIAFWREGVLEILLPLGLPRRQRAGMADLLLWRLLGRSMEPALGRWADRLNETHFRRPLAGAGFHHQMGRWGSCSTRHRIYLSHRLLIAPPGLAGAVLLHELAHLDRLNHGPEFWRSLSAIDPDCRRRRSQLASYGAAWSGWWIPRLRRLLQTGEVSLEPSLADWEGFASFSANILRKDGLLANP